MPNVVETKTYCRQRNKRMKNNQRLCRITNYWDSTLADFKITHDVSTATFVIVIRYVMQSSLVIINLPCSMAPLTCDWRSTTEGIGCDCTSSVWLAITWWCLRTKRCQFWLRITGLEPENYLFGEPRAFGTPNAKLYILFLPIYRYIIVSLHVVYRHGLYSELSSRPAAECTLAEKKHVV